MLSADTLFLIVDDSLTTRNLLVKQLLELGFSRFWHASDGDEAWKHLISSVNPPVGVVFCDWNMPNMNGLELLKKIRVDERFRDLLFFMITSERAAEKVQEAIREGVTNYLVKPFSSKTVKEKLQRTSELLKKKSEAA